MSKTLEDRTIALAAMFQSAYAVVDIATTWDTRINIECLVRSVFNTNPKDTPSIYESGVVSGYQNLDDLKNPLMMVYSWANPRTTSKKMQK